MASRKTRLLFIFTALSLFGLVVSCFPFMASLRPNSKAYAALPSFPIPDLQPNSFTYIPHPRSLRHHGASILVISDANANLTYLSVPTIDRKTAIPDVYPWRPGWICGDLSPDFDLEVIRCKDPDLIERIAFDPQWDLAGRDLTNSDWLPDFEHVVGREVLGNFVLLSP